MVTHAKLRNAVLSVFEHIEIPITMHELFIEIFELGGYGDITTQDLQKAVQRLICMGKLEYAPGLKIRKPVKKT